MGQQAEMERVELYFDGCVWPTNPGERAGYGFIICKGTQTIKQSGQPTEAERIEYKGKKLFTCNIAEWAALVSGLTCLVNLPAFKCEEIKVYGDSQLVINQAKGLWRTRDHLKKYRDKLRELEKLARYRITYEWIDREENYSADEQSKIGAGMVL